MKTTNQLINYAAKLADWKARASKDDLRRRLKAGMKAGKIFDEPSLATVRSIAWFYSWDHAWRIAERDEKNVSGRANSKTRRAADMRLQWALVLYMHGLDKHYNYMSQEARHIAADWLDDCGNADEAKLLRKESTR